MKKKLCGVLFLALAGSATASYAETKELVGLNFLVAKCDVTSKKCETPQRVTDKWPNLKGTPFASVIHGGFDADENRVSMFSGSEVGLLWPDSGNYMYVTNTFYHSAPAFLQPAGAEVMFNITNNRALYIKGDTAVIRSGSDWQAPHKFSDLFPGVAGTIFAKKLDAAVPVPGSNNERAFVFSGGLVAVLNINTGQFDGEPKPVTEVFSGLWDSWRGIYGAFNNGDNNLYLFSYTPLAD